MLLYYAVVTLHVIVCIILVLVVLLQSGKGADLAGAFGGGATQTAFGSRGPASFLSKMTTIAAVIFMMTSIALSMITTTRRETKSILETTKGEAAKPAEKAPAKQPPAATPTREEIQKRIEELQNQKKSQQSTPAPGQQNQTGAKPEGSQQPAK
jgi:preprotein translocase subunit SecG